MKPMESIKPTRTLVIIRAERGTEEVLSMDVYEMCKGLWIEEMDQDRILIHLYPESVEGLLSLLQESGIVHEVMAVREEQERDYVAEIKKHFTPISVGDITILPPWKKSRRTGPKLIIEPGMAFGTGRHESTRLMLGMMTGLAFRDMTVLDLGCGSGVLAIYAHMLGAKRVVAVDHDPCAALAVHSNAALNAAQGIEVVCADLGDIKGPFDIVLANLDAGIFARDAAHVIGLVAPDGTLLVSGIEASQKNATLPLFSGLRLITRRRMKDWYGFTFAVNRQGGPCQE